MNPGLEPAYIAFEGERRIASGDLDEVARAAKQTLDRRKDTSVLIFDGRTSGPIDLDFRGSVDDVLTRLPKQDPPAVAEDAAVTSPRGPGRPKLGVVAREVTLLPRHWEWLSTQPGGASVALRKLVEEARRSNEGRDKTRQRLEAAYHFMTSMGGDLPDYEEATRALFANDLPRVRVLIEGWPRDIRNYTTRLATDGDS